MVNFRPSSKHCSSGDMSLIYFTPVSSDENDMIASSYGSSSLHWHRPCLFYVRFSLPNRLLIFVSEHVHLFILFNLWFFWKFAEGSIAINYLFVREKFKWMLTDYNLYDAFNVVCQIVGNILGVYVLNQMLGVPVLILAMVGYFSAMTEYIVAGLANYSWQLYVGKWINRISNST